MTREQAIAEIKSTAAWLRDEVCDEQAAFMTELALDTLAPVIRRKPPTVEEVGDEEMCWVWYDDMRLWTTIKGRSVRGLWGLRWPAHCTSWLPYTAIPEGGA